MVNIDTILLKVTNKCNEKCEFCYMKKEKSQEIVIEDYYNLFKSFEKLGIEIVNISGGEPLMRGDIGEIIKMLSKLGMYSRLATNGKLLNKTTFIKLRDSGLSNLQVSVGDMTNLIQVNSILKLFLEFNEIKNNLKLGINLITSHNFFQTKYENINNILNNFKVDWIDFLHPKFAGNYDWYIKNKMDKEDIRALSNLIFEKNIKNHSFSCGYNLYTALNNNIINYDLIENNCNFLSSHIHFLVISSDGKVYPCPFTMTKDNEIGNILDEDIEVIIEKYSIMKSKFTKSKQINLPCMLRTKEIS